MAEYTDVIIHGDVREELEKLPGDLVDCIVTSPPYWGLRDYGVNGQIGLEQQPKDYIENIVSIFRKAKRVLKPTGTVFLNIGDTYYGKMGFTEEYANKSQWHPDKPLRENLPKTNWLQPKQKLLIPERVAIAMQEDGWILRNSVIWFKPNHMPASITDRLTGSYETVFFFVKQRNYYFNLDSIRRPHLWADKDKRSLSRRVEGKSGKITEGKYATNAVGYHPLGANPGDVWSINTEPSFDSHFATFPTKLVKQCLKCGCPKDGLVLDPFAGSGTALLVARKLAMHYIGIELNPEYVTLAKKRLTIVPERLDGFLEPQINTLFSSSEKNQKEPTV